jgi:hypothetical protein
MPLIALGAKLLVGFTFSVARVGDSRSRVLPRATRKKGVIRGIALEEGWDLFLAPI